MAGGLDPVLVWTLRASLALLFGVAAFHKLADRAAFARAVRDYRLLPGALAGGVAGGIAGVEAAVGAGLLVPGTASLAAAGGAGLLLVYSTAIAWNLARGRRHIDCGCGGPGHRRPLSARLLARNGLLVLACGLAATAGSRRPLVWVDLVSIAGGAAVVALLYGTIGAAIEVALQPVGRTS